MERTEEENILICELFDTKAKLQVIKNDDDKKEKMLKRISEIRDRLTEIKTEQLIKEREQEARTVRNGKF